MTTSLLAVSIGPVQDFIAAGRKTRDLWFGSTLLGDVSRAAAEHLAGVDGVELIFPARASLGIGLAEVEKLPVANKLLAHVPDGSPITPKGLAEGFRSAAERVIQARLTEAWDEIGRRRGRGAEPAPGT